MDPCVVLAELCLLGSKTHGIFWPLGSARIIPAKGREKPRRPDVSMKEKGVWRGRNIPFTWGKLQRKRICNHARLVNLWQQYLGWSQSHVFKTKTSSGRCFSQPPRKPFEYGAMLWLTRWFYSRRWLVIFFTYEKAIRGGGVCTYICTYILCTYALDMHLCSYVIMLIGWNSRIPPSQTLQFQINVLLLFFDFNGFWRENVVIQLTSKLYFHPVPQIMHAIKRTC